MSGSGGIAQTPAPGVQPSALAEVKQIPGLLPGFLEAPQMGLMDQMRMFQQQKGAQNKAEQMPQSSNPYQQMQDQRYQKMLMQPRVSMPSGLLRNYMPKDYTQPPGGGSK